METTTLQPLDAYRRGKATANPAALSVAVKAMRQASVRRRNGLAIDPSVVAFCWGVIMASAQAIDPRVNHRYAAITALGLDRRALFG